MSGSLIDERGLINLAYTIRSKNGLSAAYKPIQMATAINELPTEYSGVTDPIIANILDGSIVSIDDEANHLIKTVGLYTFYECMNLVSVNLPVCTSIGYDAFYGCTNLENVSVPQCTSIGNNAFENCTKLTSFSGKVGTIGQYAFRGSGLQEYFSSSGGTINTGAFANCGDLVTVSFGGACSFYNCFTGCYNLESLILSYPTKPVTWYNSPSTIRTQLQDTKLLTTGYIYVPADLVEAYGNVEGWELVTDRIVPIPEPEPEPEEGV